MPFSFLRSHCQDLCLIALSAKHHSFYLIPGFVFYALAFAAYLTPASPLRWQDARGRIYVMINLLLAATIAGIAVYSQSRSERYYHSHRRILQQNEILAPPLPAGSAVQAPLKWIYERGDLACYLERYYDIRLTEADTTSFILLEKNSRPEKHEKMIPVAETMDFLLLKSQR